MSLKKKFKKDLSNDLDLSFDTSKLESNNSHSKSRIKIFTKRIVLTAVLVPLSLVVIAPLIYILSNMEDSVTKIHRNFTLAEIRDMDKGSFKALNKIPYPTSKGNNAITHSEKDAYLDYTYQTYKNLPTQNNFMFSPLTLYGFFIDSYGAISDENLKEKYDALLATDKINLSSFYRKVFENNFFALNDGTVQLHNGTFIDNWQKINEEYVNYLSSVYTECFSLELHTKNDFEKMMNWVNQSVGEKDFMKTSEVPITENTTAYWFSTMNFDIQWQNQYLKSKTHTGTFNTNSGAITTNYMTHTYSTHYYDYGDYISVLDSYNYGYTITYIVPKKADANVYDLTKDVNIFKENEDNIEQTKCELHVPKFEITALSDNTKLIENLGMGSMLDDSNKSFNNMYVDLEDDVNIYLEALLQKNYIKMNEDGTKIKSVNLGAAGGTKAGYVGMLKVELNQPFIYIIKDSSGLPLYVGHIDNPN